MAAQRFCNSSDITKLECDWAGEAEDSRTAAGTFTGSLWMNPPKPPQVLESSRTYYQIASRVVSLACKPGKLTVRSVFKFLPGSTGCSRLLLDTDTLGSQGSLGGSTGSVTRCTLRIAGPDAGAANGTGPAAIQAAMSAPDNACQTCKTCATCPQDIGVWYSDSAVFSFSGCEGLAQRPRDSYTPTKPGVVINPGNKILLAALTVKPATG